MSAIQKNNFPKEILPLRRWFGWRKERCPIKHRPVKVPYNPANGYHASVSDPSTWASVDEAIASVEKYKLDGIGFAFTEDDDIIGVDLDKCILDGKLNEIATGFLAKAPKTYVEKSPSGKGLHALLRGKLPPEAGKGKRNTQKGVEMYASSRYFTMTGDKWHECQDEIAQDNGVLE
jgi:primase-polymerase (primpol)-like protein